jgi:DUF1365 family protein
MQFYNAEIFHARQSPSKNKFAYKGLYFSFWLDEEGVFNRPFFSWQRWNLFSFYREDHAQGCSEGLRAWAFKQLEKAGLSDFKGRIRLVTMPRMLGYVFNPVSFWYCYEEDHLKAVICEVNNTFGEGHNYVVIDPMENKNRAMDKVFHVSPFYPVKGTYQFDFTRENFVSIQYQSEFGHFIATMKGEEFNGSLLKLFLNYPLYTFLVVFLIHYQALKLFFKKVPFFKKPKQRNEKTTFEYLKEESQ